MILCQCNVWSLLARFVSSSVPYRANIGVLGDHLVPEQQSFLEDNRRRKDPRIAEVKPEPRPASYCLEVSSSAEVGPSGRILRMILDHLTNIGLASDDMSKD